MQELIQQWGPEIVSYIRSHALPTLTITVIGILLIRLIRRGVKKVLGVIPKLIRILWKLVSDRLCGISNVIPNEFNEQHIV